jgi:DNA-binding response OmpR family regulator
MNIVMAMNMGGDDFIKKPFDLDVMMAKLQAILRRNYEYAQPMESSCLKYNELVLNLLDACFEYEDNKVELTKNEFKILEVLIRKAGEIVSRDDIMVKLWDTDSFVDENTLTVNVNRLRKKLEKAGAADFIGTKKGMGYYLK